jgi:hypothetical protein
VVVFTVRIPGSRLALQERRRSHPGVDARAHRTSECAPLTSRWSCPKPTALDLPKSGRTGIAAQATATTAGGGQYADITDLFCTPERCPVIVGNTLVYFDSDHMTLEYSRAPTPAIGALTDRALADGG